MTNWLQTFTGARFYPSDPRPADIHIEDIAHALSYINRFGGHLPEPWTVAQHALVMAEFAPPRLRLATQMHDSPEAYLGDVVKPLKQMLPEYQRLEGTVYRAIFDRFEIGEPCERICLDPIVEELDLRMLVTEAQQFIPHRIDAWDEQIGVEPLDVDLKSLRGESPQSVKAKFLRRFARYTEHPPDVDL